MEKTPEQRPKTGKIEDEPKGHSSPYDPVLEELHLLRLILDNIYNGVMVTDAEGYVTYFNAPYGRFLGVEPKDQIGRHCTDVVENSRMHIVAKTGRNEINDSHRIRGQNMVVQRIPIRRDGKVIAVFGQVMFKDVQDVGKLAKKLSVLESKVELYEKELMSLRSTRYTLDGIVSVSDAMVWLKREALKAAATHLPVLITGESGTGKELFAQGIHHASARRLYPFIRINCAAIPHHLLESELFGYEKGAFTGANSTGKAGKFELGHHGTVFLDEIGDLPLEMQPKLLRVLEEKEFERIGGNSLIRSDFRLIAATNRSLEEMVEQGLFRKDLFYRINVIPLHVPPLRDRREDIAPLARHLLEQVVEDSPLPDMRLHPETAEILQDYHWPGNARELSNVLERICSTLEGDVIIPSDLPFYLTASSNKATGSRRSSLRDVTSRSEKEAIGQALAATNNNKARAAALLGIHRTLLYKKMKKYGLNSGSDR